MRNSDNGHLKCIIDIPAELKKKKVVVVCHAYPGIASIGVSSKMLFQGQQSVFLRQLLSFGQFVSFIFNSKCDEMRGQGNIRSCTRVSHLRKRSRYTDLLVITVTLPLS